MKRQSGRARRSFAGQRAEAAIGGAGLNRMLIKAGRPDSVRVPLKKPHDRGDKAQTSLLNSSFTEGEWNCIISLHNGLL
jgi:hypothetical protein